MDLGLKGRVALVAGASQGIGRATAMAFAAEGADVAICARNEAALEEVARQARDERGVKALTGAVDVADAEAIAEFVRRVEAEMGRVDVCVPNA